MFISNGNRNKKHDSKVKDNEDEDGTKSAVLIAEIGSMILYSGGISQCKGVARFWASQKESLDIHANSLYHSQKITSIKFNNGRRYGLIGLNDCRK